MFRTMVEAGWLAGGGGGGGGGSSSSVRARILYQKHIPSKMPPFLLVLMAYEPASTLGFLSIHICSLTPPLRVGVKHCDPHLFFCVCFFLFFSFLNIKWGRT